MSDNQRTYEWSTSAACHPASGIFLRSFSIGIQSLIFVFM